jgi:hypothetical protein
MSASALQADRHGTSASTTSSVMVLSELFGRTILQRPTRMHEIGVGEPGRQLFQHNLDGRYSMDSLARRILWPLAITANRATSRL